MKTAPQKPSPEIAGKWKTGTLVYTQAGIFALFCWLLLGDFAWSMRDRSVGAMAQWYLNHLSVPNVLFGLLITSIPAIIGIVLGPIVSVKSDRYRSSWGRRIPFLLITTPVGAVSMIGLGATPLLSQWLHILSKASGFAWEERVIALACFTVFWAAFEFATIAGQAVFGGLVNDVVPKPLLGRFYGLFRAVSLIDGIIFNFWILGKVPHYYSLIFPVIGLFYGTAFMLVCCKIREGKYPENPPESFRKRSAIGNASLYLKECFSNSYYVAVFGMLTLAGLSFTPVNLFSIPYAGSLGVTMETYGKCVAATFLISFILAYFIGWLADLFHPLRMMVVALGLYLAVSLWSSIYAVNTKGFIIAWVMHGIVSGFYFTSAASLGQRLFPALKFAQFSSAAVGCISLANMLIAPLMGAALDATGSIYRYTFMAGFVLSFLALGLTLYVYRRFQEHGGPGDYSPPQPCS